MSWFLLVFAVTAAAFALFVGFMTCCAMIGASRAFRQMPQALRAAFEAPPSEATRERVAFYWLIRAIAQGQIREPSHLWVYDPDGHYYKPVDTAERVKALAEQHGQAKVVRWDADLGQFDETTVTPDMPVSELLG